MTEIGVAAKEASRFTGRVLVCPASQKDMPKAPDRRHLKVYFTARGEPYVRVGKRGAVKTSLIGFRNHGGVIEFFIN